MKLLLHACCGPCSLEPVRILQQAGHDITIFYANSNIAPGEEYAHRLSTLKTWAQGVNLPVIEGSYQPALWAEKVGCFGLAHNNPLQREQRCKACYKLRLEETARYAAQNGFEGIATTLSVSPYQYTSIIQEELQKAAGIADVTALFEDFRPYYEEATRRSRALGMYRQNYCGCSYSYQEAEYERAERKAARAAERAAYEAAHAEERAAEETARLARRTEREAYAQKQARKHAVLKALREQAKKTSSSDL